MADSSDHSQSAFRPESVSDRASTPTSEKVALKRRAHRKSRMGCQECKRRRIKCDEERPRCANCVRHSARCLYPTLSELPAGQSPDVHPSPSSPSLSSRPSASHCGSPEVFTASKADADSARPRFELKDLALLHHWTLTTSKSILNTPDLDHFWQQVFPEIGFQHDYVMHAILSLTALHIVYLQPSNHRSFLCEAVDHHTRALQGFRRGIDSLGPQNSDALFASATLSFFYAFLTFGKLYDDHGEASSMSARTSRALGSEWIPLVRGVQTVLLPVYEHVITGPLSSLLMVGNWDELDPDKQPSPDDEYLRRIQGIWAGDENADVYNQTLFMLRRCSTWMAQFGEPRSGSQPSLGYNRDWSGPFIWLFSSPEQYFNLQSQRQPPALIIFAHFGALLQRLEAYWWMNGCGRSIVAVVDEVLGPYWRPHLEWPRSVVGLQ